MALVLDGVDPWNGVIDPHPSDPFCRICYRTYIAQSPTSRVSRIFDVLWVTGVPETSGADGPHLDFGPEPEARPTRTKIYDRAGHVRIPSLVEANGVPLSESQ